MSKILIDEATVKLALKALEFFKGLSLSMGEIERAEESITPLREALAEQPAQHEPYGYVSTHTNGLMNFNKTFHGVYRDTATEVVAVYTSPQPAQQQEPIWFWTHPTHGRLYKQPPAQRPWVGLTDKDVENLCISLGAEPIEVRFIEAKLKEKNT